MGEKATLTREDVLKWLVKLEPLAEMAEVNDPKAEELLENAKAYVKDARHWLNEENLVLAFECMVHSWAILEAARELGAISVPEQG
jgi:hypothetical protein